MKKIFILCSLLLSLIHTNAQITNIDSLKQVLSIAKEDTNKVWVLDALSQNYIWSFADTALVYAQQELRLSQQLNFKSGEAWALNRLGVAYTTLGNYPGALDFGYKSLALFKSLKNDSGMLVTNLNLGLCYREQGDYKRAIQCYKESIRLSSLLQHSFWNPVTIGALIASTYERNNQLDSALYLLLKAYKISEWSGNSVVLGNIYAKLGNAKQAIEYYREAISLAMRYNSQIDILDAYNGIAKIYFNAGEKDSAIYYAEQTLAQKWGRVYPIGLLHATKLLADIYSSQNKSDSTVKYLKLTISFKDSLFNQQKIRAAQSFAFNEQLHQQELQQALEQSQLKYKNRLNIYVLLAGLLILLIVAGGLWRRNIHRKKSFTMLQQQKHETDIQKEKAETTLEELRSTQAQLIQSEKMASLGELTAGIAHEIQNPLNFVNNFSEVNKEMIEELLSERSKVSGERDEELENEILNDLKDNEEKINHHGKRADAIVKSMLEHSRTSTGIKEPTDINKLADEYLRLAYHGLRAKDKSFNADIRTGFDNSIGKVNIVPQDIGRVLLNLFNNAFYATNQKQKDLTGFSNLSGQLPYVPTVTVVTKKLSDKIEITVSDNGAGISQNIIDKIFQPFFTTKPTGQGTGLGLSLAYDIVKAHGGEIKVETKEDMGSEFVIQLPV